MLYITKKEISKEMPVGKKFAEGVLAFTVLSKNEEEQVTHTLHAKTETIPPSTGTVPVMIENSLHKKAVKSPIGIPYKPKNNIRNFTKKLAYNYKEKSGIRAFA